MYLASLFGLVLVGGTLAWIGRLQSVHAAEGDTAKTNMELDVSRGEAEGMESEAFKYNEEGEIEWMSTSTRPRIVILGTGWVSEAKLASQTIWDVSLALSITHNSR
jgi:hypothetical protein